MGHGIGTKMHMAPDVLNYSVSSKGVKLQPGMVLALTPKGVWVLTARDGGAAGLEPFGFAPTPLSA